MMSKNSDSSEVIKEGIVYSINDENNTAEIEGLELITDDIIIPRSINHKNQEYIITSISKYAFYENIIKSIQFPKDSEVKTIAENVFWGSTIETIYFPSSVIELEDGWCDYTGNLTKIIIDPSNPRYSMYKDEYIIGKSTLNQSNYDILVFAVRNIENAFIPNFIEIIGPYSFCVCENLKKIEFPSDSKIKEIQKGAFSCSSINKIVLPSSITKICEEAFVGCENLEFVTFSEDSELKSIGKLAFSSTSLCEISIPSKLVELEDSWFHNSGDLMYISVMPKNPYFMCLDSELLLRKSSNESQNFDILALSVRNIKKVAIPSFIKIIENHAFEYCCELQIVDFSEDSRLQIIGKNGFYSTAIDKIKIPYHVTKIDIFAFYNCIFLNKVQIPIESELEFIGKRAFAKTLIESLYITSHVNEIGVFAFENCSNLHIIEIDENSELKSIDSCVFKGVINGVLMVPINLKELKFTCNVHSEYE